MEEALKEIKKIINDAAQGNIKQEELIRAKNKIISSLEFLNESNSSIAEGNALDLIEYQKVIPDKEVINEYNQITLREVIDCAIQLNKSKSYVVSSVGNHDKKILNLF